MFFCLFLNVTDGKKDQGNPSQGIENLNLCRFDCYVSSFGSWVCKCSVLGGGLRGSSDFFYVDGMNKRQQYAMICNSFCCVAVSCSPRIQGCGEFHALLLALLQTSSFKSTTHQANGMWTMLMWQERSRYRILILILMVLLQMPPRSQIEGLLQLLIDPSCFIAVFCWTRMLAALIEKNFKWYQLVTYFGTETAKNNKFLFMSNSSMRSRSLKHRPCWETNNAFISKTEGRLYAGFFFEAMFDAGHRSSSPRLVPKRGLSGLRPLQVFSTETVAILLDKHLRSSWKRNQQAIFS